ncbi:hypothetical protein DFP77_10611 [Marinomonas foliarum]|uniref:Uncharacterized protein n=1 Tax=Marinomonas foliarum TaxID=491950 RepID=A0A369AI83_9GAMM|nr:hypothetical protein DFP77_10611 [Marinomonas foliarum]
MLDDSKDDTIVFKFPTNDPCFPYYAGGVLIPTTQ